MSNIQFENRHPNELAVAELYVGMNEHVVTPNGNQLIVRPRDAGVGIFDGRLLAGKYPMYMFIAFIEQPGGRLRAIVRSRAPGDWPHRRHPDIRPLEQMRQTVDYLDAIGNPVATFRSNWTVDDPFGSTNALLFRRYVDDPAYGGLDRAERERIAALRTPTGQMMTRLGFVLDAGSIADHGNVIEADFLREE